ncbi:MAG: glycosyltransferase, partial [Oscillospiraceae bacterium]
NLGYPATATLPIVFDKKEYLSTIPSDKVVQKYGNDGFTNILFVGRIAPNKRHEDILHTFAVYNKYINSKSRLFFVGNSSGSEKYYNALKCYITENGIENVIFPGHISFQEIVAYYKIANVFLCESEHEGFCVPLLEAMTFDVPILAYSSTAIPWTLGGSGVLFTEKDHQKIAEMMDIIVNNSNFREQIINGQQERLEFFDIENTKNTFEKLILPWINK